MKVVAFLKEKIFNSAAGDLRMTSLKAFRSSEFFTVAPNGTGLQVEQLTNFTLKWEHFQKIVEKANQLGGKMYRGDAIPMNSGRLGVDISYDCMEGFIAGELLGTEEGKKVTRRSTYYSGILDWARIVTLHPKCDENGSYITVEPEFRNI